MPDEPEHRHIESLPVEEDEERPGWVRRDAQPFEPGNTAAVTYGAWSARLVSEKAQQVLLDLQEACPWIVDADGMVLDVLVKSKVRLDEFDEVIEQYFDHARTNAKGETGAEAIPDRILQQVSRESRTVMECCGKLGLTATDRAALMKDTSWARALAGKTGAAAVADRGRAIRESRGRLPA